MNYLSNVTRQPGDPKVIRTGVSSRGTADSLGQALGWFSIGLGVLELMAPRGLARSLGMRDRPGLVSAYGVREIGAGVLSLSVDKNLGLWSRVAGDVLDVATLATILRPSNRKLGNVKMALTMVLGITLLDVITAQSHSRRHSRQASTVRHYADRSGFPRGLASARGAAKDFKPA